MTNNSEEKDLLKLATESGQTDLALLITAKEQAKRRVMDDPNPANLSAFDKASRMLNEHIAGEKEASFENRLEVYKHLKRLGYKIGRTKLYQDVKDGKLQIQNDGSVLETDVKAYISKAGLIKPDQLQYEVESSQLTRAKQRREVEMLETRLEKTTIELNVLKKNLLDRNQVETEQAIKAGALMAGLTHTFRIFARDAIQLVEGNLKHTQALVNFWNAKAEDLFDEFARMDEIQVKLKN